MKQNFKQEGGKRGKIEKKQFIKMKHHKISKHNQLRRQKSGLKDIDPISSRQRFVNKKLKNDVSTFAKKNKKSQK